MHALHFLRNALRNGLRNCLRNYALLGVRAVVTELARLPYAVPARRGLGRTPSKLAHWWGGVWDSLEHKDVTRGIHAPREHTTLDGRGWSGGTRARVRLLLRSTGARQQPRTRDRDRERRGPDPSRSMRRAHGVAGMLCP